MMKEPQIAMSKEYFSIKGSPAVPLTAHRAYRNGFKRIGDIFVSLIAIVVLAIPMLLIAALVKLTSKGPVFFRQVRYGKNSRPFTMVKFRSMAADAPEKANKDFSQDAMARYVTPLGRFLRKSSLDELPQLFNVLAGKMSLIGPRPLASTDALVLQLRKQNGADQVRPGITGLAQVNGRNEVSDEDKAAFDAEYARRCSLIFDIRILIESVVVVIQQRGINKDE